MVEGSVDDALAVREALKKELRLEAEVSQRQRLETYARLWLNARLGALKSSTATKYANDLEGHIIPALGAFWIDALRPSDVQQFISEQLESYSGWSVVNRLRLLRTIAKDAVAEGLADSEFTARVKPPAVRLYSASDPNLLSARELGKVLVAIPNQWSAVVTLMVTTGLRWGEASGLKWADIDLDVGVARVRRTNWKGIAQTPKTGGSYRDVPLVSDVVRLLAEHRQRLLRDQNPGLSKDWVFPTREGTLHKGTPLRSVLERTLKDCEIEVRVTPHGLRRTFNNIARRVTSDIVLKSMTGHVTDAMVEHYSVVDLAEKKKAAADVLRLVTEEGK